MFKISSNPLPVPKPKSFRKSSVVPLFLTLLILGAVTLFVAGACGGEEKATPTPTRVAVPTPTAIPLAEKQELRVNLAGEPDNIDPNRASFSTEISVIRNVFEGLLSFNEKLEVVPVVASVVPNVQNGGISADGLVYTFSLRSDVKWSDGKAVTAKDFVYSIKRMLKPELAADYASFYYDIKGGQALNSATASTPELLNAVSVEAPNDTTLKITLQNTRPTFLQIMALWPAAPLREDIVERLGDKWTEPPNYIGNGPFILTEWVHQDHMTFEPNPNYWGPKPKLSKVVYKMITDVNAELAAYKAGELDISRVPPGTEKTVMADPALSKEILRYSELTTFAIQFNVKKPPFDDKAVRRALSMGIDRDTYINQIRNGVGRPATSWIPPGMPGFDANLGSELKFDAAKAKAALAAAGYSDVSKLPTITFHYSDTAGNRTLAQFIQGQFQQNLGIKIELGPLESKAFQAMVKANSFHMAFLGWGADYPDPDNWLPELWGTGAGNNHTNYSSVEFDKLAEQGKKELDSAKSLTIWAQAQKIVVDDAPVIFLFNRERFALKKPTVAGLKVTGMDGQMWGDFFLEEVYVTK